MNRLGKKIFFICIVLFAFISCKEEEENNDTIVPTSTVQLNFDNVVGNEDLILDSGTYTNYFEQRFHIAKFNYFISNVALFNERNEMISIYKDSSYFLIKEKDAFSHNAILRNIPNGNYTSIQFTIGVDSLKSTAPLNQRTSSLDPGGYAADMYWTWNQGYIFMKLECHPYKVRGDTTIGIPYVYHIGGFGGYNTPTINNIKTVQFAFPNTLKLDGSTTPTIHFKVDALKVLTGSTNIDFEKNPTVMLTNFSKNVADNYVDMFELTKIE